MVFELLTGQWPFIGENLDDWKRVHQTVPPPSLRERHPRPPADLEQFVAAALIKVPEARLQVVQRWLQKWEQDQSPILVSRASALQPVAKCAHQDSSTIMTDPPTVTSS